MVCTQPRLHVDQYHAHTQVRHAGHQEHINTTRAIPTVRSNALLHMASPITGACCVCTHLYYTHVCWGITTALVYYAYTVRKNMLFMNIDRKNMDTSWEEYVHKLVEYATIIHHTQEDFYR